MPIKAILFDLGKVLVDFNFRGSFQKLARSCDGMSAQDVENYFLQSGLEVLYDGGKITSRQFHTQVKKALGHRLTYDQFKVVWNDIFSPNRNMIHLLGELRKRYRIVLISNTNEMHYVFLKKKYAFFKHFHRIILSYREKRRKPDASLYRTAFRACQAKPSEIFYIDDRPDLTEAAAELGARTFTYRKNFSQLTRQMRIEGIL